MNGDYNAHEIAHSNKCTLFQRKAEISQVAEYGAKRSEAGLANSIGTSAIFVSNLH